MDPSDDKLHLLTPEFVKYLDTLRVYDDYKYVDDYKLNMDRETWHKVCNFRRMKIESEFKISTCLKDATDKDNLLDSLKRNKEDKEAMIEKLKMTIIRLENQDLYYEDNPEVKSRTFRVVTIKTQMCSFLISNLGSISSASGER